MKKITNIYKILIFFFAAFVLIGAPGSYASNVSQQQRNIDAKHRATKAKIHHLRFLENLETNKLYKNQQKLETTSKDLESSKQQYTDAKQKLSSIEGQLSNAVFDYNSTLYQVRKRIRSIYKHHRKNLFEMLISSENINNLMDNIYYQGVIAKADKTSLYNVRKNAQRIAQIRYQQEMEKRRLASSIQDINYKQQAIQQAIGKNEQLIQRLRTDRHTYERTERELASQSRSLAGMINRSTSAPSDMKVVGGFVRPISGPITSPFGWRVHPIFKSRTFHSGIDIGGPFNGAIHASNNGKVIFTGWYGGYGKVVIIDHGMYNGAKLTTLYAHLNSWSVSVGEYVTRGQVVGREGSTGYSTGPHCHFEVRVNGQPRNPLSYI